MNATKIVLIFGVIAGIGMLAWGMSGLVTGKILTKSYGSEDGERKYSRFVSRADEPAWFWVICATYLAVGVSVLVIAATMLVRRIPF